MNWPLIVVLGALVLLAGWLLERRGSRSAFVSREPRASGENSPLPSPPPHPMAHARKCPFCAEAIQDEAIKCRYCGEMLPAPGVTAAAPHQGTPLLRGIGALMFVGGAATAVYYFGFFDTTVETPTATLLGQTVGGERVHNIGLMQDRQDGLILGALGSVVGLALVLYTQKRGR